MVAAAAATAASTLTLLLSICGLVVSTPHPARPHHHHHTHTGTHAHTQVTLKFNRKPRSPSKSMPPFGVQPGGHGAWRSRRGQSGREASYASDSSGALETPSYAKTRCLKITKPT